MSTCGQLMPVKKAKALKNGTVKGFRPRAPVTTTYEKLLFRNLHLLAKWLK